jgi:hypothetical protein
MSFERLERKLFLVIPEKKVYAIVIDYLLS